ncbi:hypothetical protein [Nostoc sp.]|uniref:hypothetical protein n=1 Tax=Nostoc sp. TaxID=1180 RepID=UPI002FF573CC
MKNIATAQTADISQQVEQGVKNYKAGDIRGAIETWQKALNAYKKDNNAKNAAIVSENLARAYRQLNDTKEAIAVNALAVPLLQPTQHRLLLRSVAATVDMQ